MKLIKFILNDTIISSDERDLNIPQIEAIKNVLAIRYKCDVNDIDVIFEEKDVSEYDIGVDGMFMWKDLCPKYIKGVGLSIKEGSDQYLDSILNNTLEDYLIFV